MLGFLVLGVVALGLSRAGLLIWQWPRVIAAADSVIPVMLQGLRSDLIMIGWLIAPTANTLKNDMRTKNLFIDTLHGT